MGEAERKEICSSSNIIILPTTVTEKSTEDNKEIQVQVIQ
jgi:hypothetical protein